MEGECKTTGGVQGKGESQRETGVPDASGGGAALAALAQVTRVLDTCFLSKCVKFHAPCSEIFILLFMHSYKVNHFFDAYA